MQTIVTRIDFVPTSAVSSWIDNYTAEHKEERDDGDEDDVCGLMTG